MKIGVIGDIHANLEALEAVLKSAEEMGVTHYACIGDIVGYNANPHECLEIVRNLELIAVVGGNHDSYTSSARDLASFNPQAAQAVEWTRQQLSEEELQWLGALPTKKDVFLRDIPARFSLVHATMDNPENWGYIFDKYTAAASMQYQWMPICFYGHSHVPMSFTKDLDEITGGPYDTMQLENNRKYLINVGSVGQPRDRDPRAAFVVYDTDKSTVTLHRIEYDILKAQRKILAAGLPKRCADRLETGN